MDRELLNHLFRSVWPYIVTFLLGVIVAWKGCGTGAKVITDTIEIEKPVYRTEYVDRWKTDTVRFVRKEIITVHDTVHDVRLDTLFLIDTLKIVEAWLTEVTKYDTTASFETSDVRLRWQNYQNVSENLVIDCLPKKVVGANFALGLHGNVGLVSDFKSHYVPMFGVGFHGSIKKTYLSANYGFNGQHYVGVGVGRKLWQR